MTRRLDALTSLRFAAAATIVLHHVRGTLHVPPSLLDGFALDHAVAFFFVLSGFVLAWAYPSLERGGWKRFLLARATRLWPAHLATLALLAWLDPFALRAPTGTFDATTFAANLALVQSWFPGLGYSYNSPAWSISTELAFYLCFPLLIRRWRETWPRKLLATAAVLLAGLAFTPADLAPTLPWTHPFGRLLEFEVGMTLALLTPWVSARWTSSRSVATALELVALGGVLVTTSASDGLFGHGLNAATEAWLVHGGASIASFAAVVLVFALERGWVSQALRSPPLVLLGEVSYAVYLLHHVVLRWVVFHAPAFSRVPAPLAGALLGLTVVAGSHALWAWLERPLRAWVLRTKPAPLSPRWLGSPLLTLSLALATGGALLVTHARYGLGLEAGPALQVALPGTSGVRFGERFELLGLSAREDDEWLELVLAWRALGPQPLDRRVAVHLLDREANIVTQADHAQALTAGPVADGATWRETLWLPKRQLAGAGSVGLALTQDRGVLGVTGGATDWDGHRLVVPLPGR